MEQLYTENIRKILKNKTILEKKLNVKLRKQEQILYIDGKAEDTFLALQVVDAIDLGFTVPQSLLLTEDDFVFEKINIKDFSRRKDLSQVRGRVIGKNRKSLDTIEDLTNCIVAVHMNNVGIIGRIEDIEKAIYAVKKIISGSKHSSVYAYLEEQRVLERKGI